MQKVIKFTMFMAFFLMSCNDNCEPTETKCKKNIAWICNDEENWEVLMNCNKVEPPELDWTCCEYEEDYTCLPAFLCADGGVE